MKERPEWDDNPDGLDPARGFVNATLFGLVGWSLIVIITYYLIGC